MSEETLVSCLKNEKVIVKFIKKRRGDITDNPKHVAHGGMLETAVKVLVPPQLRNGQMANVLTKEEKDFLEDYMRLEKGDLSMYNRDFWKKKKVILNKTDNLFDLSDPSQYIDYKILLANTNLIAPSLDDINKKATYLFYIVREGEEEQRKTRLITTKQEAYRLYGKYEDDRNILSYVLKQTGKFVSKRTKLDTLKSWVADLIDDDPSTFTKIVSDPLLHTKVLLSVAVELGVVSLKNNEYIDNASVKPICDPDQKATLEVASLYLNLPINQELKFSIEQRIKNAKE